MIRKKNTRAARQPASRKLDKRAIASLGEWSRKLSSELRFPPEWTRIKATYSVLELVELVQVAEGKRGKGRPVGEKTRTWIGRIRAEKRQGRGYLRLALEFRPDLPKELARAALRKFRSRWARQIDS